MMHVRKFNLTMHHIVCDVMLTPADLRLIRESVKLIEQPDEKVHLTLEGSKKASLALMPDTSFPIVRTYE